MALSDEDIREVLRIIDESPLDELLISTDGFTLHVKKGAAVGDATFSPPRVRTGEPEVASPTADAPSDDGLRTIEAPMLGTFYRAEGPGQVPFVEVGSEVEPGTTVCIIEVMKMMNSVPARVAGQVVDVCHENATLVEYGAPLFRVRVGGTE